MKKISVRDKKLLILLLLVAVVMLPYFLYVQPMMEKNRMTELEIEELNSTKAQLEEWMANADTFREEIAAMALTEETIFDRFPSDIHQEASILFINETEKNIPIRLAQVGFSENVSAPLISAAQADQAMDAAIDEIAGEESIDGAEAVWADTEAAAAGNTGAAGTEGALSAETAAENGDLNALSTTTSFTYSTSYHDFKEFLDYMRQYRDRMVITELNATYTSEMDTVSGSFQLIQYAISGPNRPPVVTERPLIPQGSVNIFMSAAGNFSEGSPVEAVRSDYFIRLSPPEAESAAKTVGRSGDTGGQSYLTADDNNTQEITVTFEGTEGAYTADYTIGQNAFEGERVVFSKDGPILLEITSSPRSDDQDEVAATINIDNQTDQEVQATVADDDLENPRVTLGELTGNVTVNGASLE